MSDIFNNNSIPLNDEFAVTRQLNGLATELSSLKTQVAGLLQSTVAAARAAASSVINLLRNSDLNTSDLGRRLFTYLGSGNVCAFWFSPASASAGPFTDSTDATESPEAIGYVRVATDGTIAAASPNLSTGAAFFSSDMATMRCIVVGAGPAGANLDTVIDTFTDSTHVVLHDNATLPLTGDATILVSAVGADTVWFQSGGTIFYGGAFTLVTPLQKNYCRPGVGNNIFVIFNVRLNPAVNAAAIPDDYQMRLSIWDNTTGQQKIIEGGPITATATLDRGTGAVIRHYIVKYYNASGDTFLSDVASPASVSGTPNPTAVDPGQVSVVFPVYDGVQSVQVFRSDDATSLTDYYLIDTISTGINNVQDNGARSGAIYAFTADPWRADAILPSIGPLITGSFVPFSFHILTPATYDLSATDDFSQWMRLDILDVDGNIVAIPAMALELDFFALGYRPGTWSVSADDQQAAGDFESANPNPSGSIPTGGGGAGGGGEVGGNGREFLPF